METRLRPRPRPATAFSETCIAAAETTDADAALAYRAGATEVFSWPEESRRLRETLSELLDGAARKTRTSAADRALTREVRARLRAMGEAAPKRPRVRVGDGIASVGGEVDRLWKKRRVDSVISQIPGIRSVDLRGVEVLPSGIRDSEIARGLRALLRRASFVEDRTLAVTVHEGHVVVKGTITCWEEWDHTRDLLAFSAGVRSVTDRTTIAPRRKRSERLVASRLESTLRLLLSDSAGIRPAVLGRTVVLRGQAPTLATKREAESLVRRDPAIEGAGGDDHTFTTCAAAFDFGLSPGEAWPLLCKWNSRCQPPWSERDLQQKLSNAEKYRSEAKADPTRRERASRPRGPLHQKGSGDRAPRKPKDRDGAPVAFGRASRCGPFGEVFIP